MTAITVVGAGAIGGFVGGRLLDAGVDIVFVEQNEAHVAAIRAVHVIERQDHRTLVGKRRQDPREPELRAALPPVQERALASALLRAEADEAAEPRTTATNDANVAAAPGSRA